MKNLNCNEQNICDDYICINARNCCYQDLKVKRNKKKINVKNLFPEHPRKVQKLIELGHYAKCKCCGKDTNLTFDHIIPLSKGGLDNLKNGQILCFKCNLKKGNQILTIKQLRNII